MATLCEFVTVAQKMATRDREVRCLPHEFHAMQAIVCARLNMFIMEQLLIIAGDCVPLCCSCCVLVRCGNPELTFNDEFLLFTADNKRHPMSP